MTGQETALLGDLRSLPSAAAGATAGAGSAGHSPVLWRI